MPPCSIKGELADRVSGVSIYSETRLKTLPLGINPPAPLCIQGGLEDRVSKGFF